MHPDMGAGIGGMGITISFLCDRCKQKLSLNRDTWDEIEIIVEDRTYTRAKKNLCDECVEKFENLKEKYEASRQNVLDNFWKGE
jgi:hypothetical protein